MHMLCDTDCVSCLHARNGNRKGFLPLMANVLFVSINHSLEKVFVRFPALENSCCVIFELNKFAYMG